MALAVVLFAFATWFFLRPQPVARLVQAYLNPPPGATFDFNGDFSGPPVLSKNGTRMVFLARVGKEPTSLYVQAFDSPAAVKLDGTENAAFHFWSADGEFVAFFAMAN